MKPDLGDALDDGATIFAPLCLDALGARLAAECGFRFGYLSGGALGYAYAVSEALLTLTELADATRRLVNRSPLGIIVDAGVGFGDPVHVARTVWELEASGACAIELEDQVAPKRVSHHRGVEHLVAPAEMTAKIEQAVAARQSADFLVIARTGAVKNEGFEAALSRLREYRAAGADVLMLMPENDEQRRAARAELDAPLATITALDARHPDDWNALGWNLVIDPFTAQVAAYAAVRDAYRGFQTNGRTGLALSRIFELYGELPGLAGLEELYRIEALTTER